MTRFNPFDLAGSAYDFALLCFTFMLGGLAVTTSGLILGLFGAHYLIFAVYGVLAMAASAAAWSLLLVFDKRSRAAKA